MAAAASHLPFCRLLASVYLFYCFMLLTLGPVSAQLNQTFQIYQIPNFNSSTTEKLSFYHSVTYGGDALQFTPSLRALDGQHHAGTVVLNQSFVLVSRSGNLQLPSFSTVFDMSLFRNPNPTTANSSVSGEGLSFVVFRVKEDLMDGWISCLNQTSVGIDCLYYEVIALRFYPQQITLNSRDNWLSDTGSPLRTTTHQFSPSNGTALNYTVWMDVKSSFVQLEVQVYTATRGSPKPAQPILSDTIVFNWVSILNYKERLHFGFTGPSANGTVTRSIVRSWTLSVQILQPLPPIRYLTSRIQTGVIIATLLAVVALLILIVVLGIYVRKKMRENRFLEEALRNLPGMPKEFSFTELKRATDNFSDKNKLGQGGFGAVYKGKLGKEGKLVAVKKFLKETDQGGFLAELTIINRLRHRNLVPLLGWSHKDKRLLLIYDYMPNGSVDKYLFNQENSITLSWERRYNILCDVASALNYLHNEYSQKVVHRDLKASNIMLDADLNAYLGDFGLARTIDNDRTSYLDVGEGIPGTWGYIAPEYMLTGKATRESDVFGFGAVVFEVVSGRRPGAKVGNFRVLVDWVWALHKEGRILEVIDPRLMNEYDVEEARRLLLLGLACTLPMRTARPKTYEILQIMLKSAEAPSVPLERPMFMEMLSSGSDDDTHQLEGSSTDVDPFFFSHDQSNSSNFTGGGKITT